MRYFCFYVLLLLFLAACSNDNKNDLKQFVMNAEKNAKKAAIKPLPEIMKYKPYLYEPNQKRNPFSLANLVPVESISTQEDINLPDPNRVKGPLEKYPLSQLKLVGVVNQEGHYWGLILSGDQRIVHVVKPGEYIGSDYGKIVKITKNKLVVREIKRNLTGVWIEKEQTMKITVDDENALPKE